MRFPPRPCSRTATWLPMALCLGSLLALGIPAEGDPAGKKAKTQVRPSPAAVSLEDLDWLSGHWSFELDGWHGEELWLPPEGGMMLGLNRQVTPKGRAFFEYLRIQESPTGLLYLPSPQGEKPETFRLIELDGQKVTFEANRREFPQQIRYWLDADGVLHAQISGREKGRYREVDWTYRLLDAAVAGPADASVPGS